VRKLADTLRQAVKLRLISDVPLGLFLSGGIDSSALATLATEVSDTPIQTVNIGFDQPQWDESEAALAIARHLGTEHHVLHLTGQDILEDLPQVLAAVDQPTVDGFNTFYVSRLARRAGLTVALSGLGGDEVFGGYASFQDVPRALRIQKLLRHLRTFTPPASLLLSKLSNRRYAKIAQMLRRDPTTVALYLLRRELFLPDERREFFPQPPNCDPASGMAYDVILDAAVNCSGLDRINQISYLEIATYMRNMLLRDSDVFGMVNGLEIRTPLLDHLVVEQVAPLPGFWKTPAPYAKPLLIDAVGPRFPHEVLTRPKRGFTFPWDAWLRGPLHQRAAQAVENRELWRHLGLAPDAPARLWTRFIARDRRVAALQVVALMVFEDYAARHGLRSSQSFGAAE